MTIHDITGIDPAVRYFYLEDSDMARLTIQGRTAEDVLKELCEVNKIDFERLDLTSVGEFLFERSDRENCWVARVTEKP